MENIISTVRDVITLYGLKIISAILILIVGFWIAKMIKKYLKKILGKRNLDATINSFICNLTYTAMIVFVVIATLAQVGIQTTSFIAVIGAAGLAVGFALQGALANFAAGFLLILFRPFKAGDFVQAGGSSGTIEEVQILYTQMKTVENIKVVIPNGKIMGDSIINYSANEMRRAEWIFGIGYGDDMKKARGVLKSLIESDKRILTDPAPQILVKELADSSVNFGVRAYIKTSDFWGVYFDMTEKVKEKFDQEGINIPFPQRDVHLFQSS
ncbi:MAG TPA: mechanosensitive ion channel domain-containing protein [Ignavibacteriaceae bacterium]|nr:mechanosensitive ion channel domain-containing protein [Ignavibacteriaceae bacterium]